MISSSRGGMQYSECFSPLGIGVSDYVLLKLLVEKVILQSQTGIHETILQI